MAKPSSPASTPSAYPEQAPGGWTVEKIRSAITSLEQGYLGPASRLVRALSRHPRYVQGRDQFIGAVMGCPVDIVPASLSYGGVGAARSTAQAAGRVLADVLSDSAERWLIEYSRMLPLTVGVLSWDLSSRPWRPVALTRWPGEAIRVDLRARRLWAILENGLEQEIIPGNGTWVVSWAGGPFDFATGLIRCMGEAWIRGINAGRDVANRSQANATAAIVSETPVGEEMESERTISVGTKLENLQKGGLAGIQLPPGWAPPTTLDLASKDATPSLELAVDNSTTDLLVPWLMQDGTAKNEGGSLAKAQVLDGVLFSAVAATVSRLWGEIGADNSPIPGVITEQILKPWVAFQLEDPSMVERICPLALRRVPDLEEDARLSEASKRSMSFWTEVFQIEGAIRRDMTEDEIIDLASMRGVRVPETVLRGRGARVGTPDDMPPPV